MSRGKLTPAERLQLGKVAYEAGGLEEAYRQFKLAAKSCPDCTVGQVDRLCSCKDLLKAIKENTLNNELKKPCLCDAQSNRRCSRIEHMTALSYLVALQGKAKKLKHCLVYAQKMVSISPRDALGYLRLGKVLRLDNQHELALALYNQGIEMVQRKHPGHELLSTLRSQANAVTKFLWKGDPLKEFPQEIALMIFRNFDTRKIVGCLRVSKQWKQFLTSSTAKTLWLQQHYAYYTKSSSCRPPSRKSLLSCLSRFSQKQLTSLTIENVGTFGMDYGKMAIIFSGCPQLKHLTLQGSMQGVSMEMPIGFGPLPELKSLYLGPGTDIGPRLVRSIIQASSQDLQELSVFSLREHFQETPSPLPNLKTLRLAAVVARELGTIGDILTITPNLRTLWVDNYVCNSWGSPEQDLRWNSLRELHIGSYVFYGGIITRPLPNQLVELFIEAEQETYLFLSHSTIEWSPVLQKCYLCSTKPQPLHLIKHAIGPSLNSGSLEELFIKPSSVDDFSWLENDSIHVLGIAGLSLHQDRDAVLLQLVAKCKRLRTLAIGNEGISPITIAKIIQQFGVTTVYHKQGHEFRELRESAQDLGVNIIHGQYPYKLLSGS